MERGKTDENVTLARERTTFEDEQRGFLVARVRPRQGCRGDGSAQRMSHRFRSTMIS
jgi:hypothetical protein